MKKQRNHFQWKDQENSPEKTNNETDFFSIIDTEFKKETMKIQKELWKAINRSADYCKKKLEAIRKNKEKVENSFTEMKAELKAMNSRMNNSEEQISDQEDRIMEITQLEQQTETQMKKKRKRHSEYTTPKYATLVYWLFWAVALEKQQMQEETFSELLLSA